MSEEQAEKIKMTRGEIFSAMRMTFRISMKAGKRGAIFSLLITLIDSVMTPINAVLEGLLVTAIVNAVLTQDFAPVLWIFLVLLAIKVLSTLTNRFSNLNRNRMWQHIYAYADEMMALKYASLPLVTRESKEGAELFERASKYQGRIASIFDDVIRIVGNIVGFVAAFVALFVISPWLSVVIVIATIPLAIVEFKQMKKSEIDWRKYSMERRKSYFMSGMLMSKDDSFELQINGLTGYFAKNMVRLRQISAKKDVEREKQFFWPRFITDVVEMVVSTGAMIFVALQIMWGKLEIGQFVTIRSLINSLSANSATAFRGFSSVGSDIIGANDFAKFMELPEQEDGTQTIPLTEVPKIEFKNVYFKYPTSDVHALENISFVIEPGDDVAIVGENGAGKTTLIKLLLGAYEPDGGEILINDIPIKELKRKEYLRHIGSLLQQFSQYNFATLGENIWYGDVSKKYSEKEITAALRRTGSDGLIDKLAGGLKQILSREFDEKNGVSLSGGQWQRLGLSRSFFRNPNILVLDEPTSAIDAKAEYAIFKDIMDSQKNKTTIIISHRFSTVRKAEKILVMDEGKIIESGTHGELMGLDGLYKEMFELQAEGYK